MNRGLLVEDNAQVKLKHYRGVRLSGLLVQPEEPLLKVLDSTSANLRKNRYNYI